MTQPASASTFAVDFVTNVFERTYRQLLQPGYIAAMAARHCYPFRQIIVVVNNVEGRASVEALLAPLLASGEISAAYFVKDRIDDALKKAGLSRAELQKTIHYTEWALVAIFLPGSPYMLYTDAEVSLLEPYDWVSPALELMKKDSRVAVANPNWTNSTLKNEAREYVGDFALGYGFSDQIFLISRREFARPIYRNWVPISWRYPLSHVAAIFEQRVDAYMRSHHRMRATCIKANYLHDSEEGASHGKFTFRARWKSRLMHAVLRAGELTPGRNPRYHR